MESQPADFITPTQSGGDALPDARFRGHDSGGIG
jgi:hypothetical protein